MIKHSSIFSQLLALIEQKKFHELVYEHHTERFAKKFTSWEKFQELFYEMLATCKMAATMQ